MADEETETAAEPAVVLEPKAHVAMLVSDLAWLMGAAEQSGVAVPERMKGTLNAAVAFLATPAQPVEKAAAPAKRGASSS